MNRLLAAAFLAATVMSTPALALGPIPTDPCLTEQDGKDFVNSRYPNTEHVVLEGAAADKFMAAYNTFIKTAPLTDYSKVLIAHIKKKDFTGEYMERVIIGVLNTKGCFMWDDNVSVEEAAKLVEGTAP